MIDQYGREIAGPFVLLPKIRDFWDQEEIEFILSLDWYQVETGLSKHLVARVREIGEALESFPFTEPEDTGLIINEDTPISLVHPVLKRFSMEDGFYHA